MSRCGIAVAPDRGEGHEFLHIMRTPKNWVGPVLHRLRRPVS